ncbi:GNAT family N-acetyltransferase [Altererythrobacter sp. ZODW24]|uniref:GNAT family N-acetyltransferase n=1 Tax=Altererythrobacter sp. ZODW24 TaxID=2185142 RepID=UPI000DF7903E|nr:GNAT family N-acetyltransferase [Altererythrobacter sp. ZODW24]
MRIEYDIRPDDLSGPEVKRLLELHLSEMHSWSPSCKVNSLPPERLKEADVTFFAAWAEGQLAACGALKHLSETRGELKAMRAASAFRGKGAGRAMLVALLDEAKQRGYTWVGLETGRPVQFADATRLYAAHGFAECDAFGDYVSDEFSVCMELHL